MAGAPVQGDGTELPGLGDSEGDRGVIPADRQLQGFGEVFGGDAVEAFGASDFIFRAFQTRGGDVGLEGVLLGQFAVGDEAPFIAGTPSFAQGGSESFFKL